MIGNKFKNAIDNKNYSNDTFDPIQFMRML